MNDKYNLDASERCADYAGYGICMFKNNSRCSYHGGHGVCKVRGNLAGKPRCKTGYDVQNGENGTIMMKSVIAGHGVMG